MGGQVQDERMFDVVLEMIRVVVLYDLVVYKIMDNFVNLIKLVQQLYYWFKMGMNEYILDKGLEGLRNVFKVLFCIKMLFFELEDGVFEWKLGVIYWVGKVEMMQRQVREEVFRVKVKKIYEEELKKESVKLRMRLVVLRGKMRMLGDGGLRSRSIGVDQGWFGGGEGRFRGWVLRYDFEGGCLGISGDVRILINEVRERFNIYNVRSWKQWIDQQYELFKNVIKDLYVVFWGYNEVLEDWNDSEKIFEVLQWLVLMLVLFSDLYIMFDKLFFLMKDLFDFLYKVGKGMLRDMKYVLFVLMSVRIEMGEVRIFLRDYLLLFIYVFLIKLF